MTGDKNQNNKDLNKMGGQQTKKSSASVGKYLIHGACFGLGKYEYVGPIYLFFSAIWVTGWQA